MLNIIRLLLSLSLGLVFTLKSAQAMDNQVSFLGPNFAELHTAFERAKHSYNLDNSNENLLNIRNELSNLSKNLDPKVWYSLHLQYSNSGPELAKTPEGRLVLMLMSLGGISLAFNEFDYIFDPEYRIFAPTSVLKSCFNMKDDIFERLKIEPSKIRLDFAFWLAQSEEGRSFLLEKVANLNKKKKQQESDELLAIVKKFTSTKSDSSENLGTELEPNKAPELCILGPEFADLHAMFNKWNLSYNTNSSNDNVLMLRNEITNLSKDFNPCISMLLRKKYFSSCSELAWTNEGRLVLFLMNDEDLPLKFGFHDYLFSPEIRALASAKMLKICFKKEDDYIKNLTKKDDPFKEKLDLAFWLAQSKDGRSFLARQVERYKKTELKEESSKLSEILDKYTPVLEPLREVEKPTKALTSADSSAAPRGGNYFSGMESVEEKRALAGELVATKGGRQTVLAEVSRLINNFETREAIALLEILLQNPEPPIMAYKVYGDICYELKYWNKAAFNLLKYLEHNPGAPKQTYIDAAFAYFNIANQEKSLLLYETSFKDQLCPRAAYSKAPKFVDKILERYFRGNRSANSNRGWYYISNLIAIKIINMLEKEDSQNKDELKKWLDRLKDSDRPIALEHYFDEVFFKAYISLGENNKALEIIEKIVKYDENMLIFIPNSGKVEKDILDKARLELYKIINATQADTKILKISAYQATQSELSFGDDVLRMLEKEQRTDLHAIFNGKNIELIRAEKLFSETKKCLKALKKDDVAAQFSDFIEIFNILKTSDQNVSNSECLKPYILTDIVPGIYREKITNCGFDMIIGNNIEKPHVLRRHFTVKNFNNWKKFLLQSERVIEQASASDQTALLMALANTWHQLSFSLISAAPMRKDTDDVVAVQIRIKELLKKTLVDFTVLKSRKPNFLEANLLHTYLNIETPSENPKMSKASFRSLQEEAYQIIISQQNPRTITRVNIHGEKLEPYKISDSLFHAITNDKFEDFIVVKLDSARHIPALIEVDGKIYRTDVFGGSRLKVDFDEGDFGSVFGVSLEAGEYFKRWFTSEESFWYGQRAFFPEKPDAQTKIKRAAFALAAIPDDKRFVVKSPFMVQDGFGFIRASAARGLGLVDPTRTDEAPTRSVSFHALQSYSANYDVAEEIFHYNLENRGLDKLKNMSKKDAANLLMLTPPTMNFLGIPAKVNGVILPNTFNMRGFGKEGVLLGRNPYSGKRLHPVNDIGYNNDLKNMKIFQYTLTGYYKETDLSGFHKQHKNAIGAFYKGLLAVVEDRDWPPEYFNTDILVSSKDIKLNQKWNSLQDKQKYQNEEHRIIIRGSLVVTQEFYHKPIMGINPGLALGQAGDFDGDVYDTISQKAFPKFTQQVIEEYNKVPVTEKWGKSFTPRRTAGNLSRILNLRKGLLETWSAVAKRYYYLTDGTKDAIAHELSSSNQLNIWTKGEFSKKYNINHARQIVEAEMEMGRKIGEDAFKVSINIDAVLERAKEYKRILKKYKAPATVAYSKKELEKNIDLENIFPLFEPALKQSEPGNVAHQVFRAYGRKLQGQDLQKCVED